MITCCKGEKAKKNLLHTAKFLKIIAEENRLKIICLLSKEDLCVCDIWNALNIPQNLTSHHLKVLKDYGLISSRKEGLNVFYTLDTKILRKAKILLNEFLAL